MSGISRRALEVAAQAYKNEADKMCKRAREAEANLAEAQSELDALKNNMTAGQAPAREVADALKRLILRGAHEIDCDSYALSTDGECQDLATLVHAWAEAEEICRAEAQEEDFRRMKDDLRESRARLDAAIDDILHRDAEGEKEC